MKIIIAERYMTMEQHKNRNGVKLVECYGAYENREALKTLGYKFNGAKKAWEIEIDPAHFADICGETAIACKLSADEIDELCDKMESFARAHTPGEYNLVFTSDGLEERYNAYCDSIGY